ncbi:MAG: NFACT family protein [Bacillota bacterium]|nr:NFACT family protein [Bacillota bacterium]
MAYDGLFLRAMIAELKNQLIGLKIDKINQPQRGAFVFTFKNRNLLISVEPSAAYIALTESKIPNPAEPPMFCMLLRKYLSGATLTDIRQEGCDRTVYFVFSALNASFEHTERTLVAEVMGRHANLLLLDERQTIIDCIKRAALDARQALPGLEYEPFQDTRKNILDLFSEGHAVNQRAAQDTTQGTARDIGQNVADDINYLREYQGFSKISALYAASRADHIMKLLFPKQSGLHVKGYTCADRDGTILDFYYLREVLKENYPDADIKEYETLSEATNAFYMRSLNAIRLKKISQDLKRTVSSRLDRINGKIVKMQAELEDARHAEHFKHMGDLILAHAYHIPEGTSRTRLLDFEGKEIEVTLDTRLTATENAQKYYQKYKKSISATKKIAEQIEGAVADADFLASAVVMLENAENEQDIEEIRAELQHTGFISRHQDHKSDAKKHKLKDKKTKKRLNVHTFTLSGGKTLLVGRSNTANDELTMRFASNSDTWLHTNTIHGSHCIIRCEGEEASEQDILEAAKVAAYYSKARHSAKVPVDYCKVRHIKKPSGARAGMVTYTNFKTILVDPSIDHLTNQ